MRERGMTRGDAAAGDAIDVRPSDAGLMYPSRLGQQVVPLHEGIVLRSRRQGIGGPPLGHR